MSSDQTTNDTLSVPLILTSFNVSYGVYAKLPVSARNTVQDDEDEDAGGGCSTDGSDLLEHATLSRHMTLIRANQNDLSHHHQHEDFVENITTFN